MRSLREHLLWVSALSLAAPAVTLAQGTARVQDVDTSVRASGMGGATTAVTWGEPGAWGNPAALAGTQGVAWLMGTSALQPGSSPDIRFTSHRFVVGGAGLGMSFMGPPLGVGSTHLSYGRQQGTDPSGNPAGTFEAFEEVESWGIGVSPVQLIDAWRGCRGGSGSPWARRLDLRFGWQWKDTELRFLPGPDGSSRAGNQDWGLQARVGIVPGDRAGRRPSLDLAFGHAVLNADEDSRFVFFDGSEAPSSLHRRTGLALHAVLPWPGAGPGGVEPWGWWFATVSRAVELGFAYDRSVSSAPGGGEESAAEGVGFEAALMRVLFVRLGHVEDRAGGVDGFSFGLGAHVPVGRWGQVGYDWAREPMAAGSDPRQRHGVSVWLHPLAVLESVRD